VPGSPAAGRPAPRAGSGGPARHWPPATSELEGMQRLLYRHACDADLVLDLHCDFEAAIHLYTLPQQWPAFASLAARLGAAV
ncbi:hypothetical protein ACV33W_30380, partial [Pseudomonas aeruginosa]